MSAHLPVDPTVVSGERKPKRRRRRPKEGFLRKDDAFDVSLGGDTDLREEKTEFEGEDNRVKWVRNLTSSPLKKVWKEFQENKNYKPTLYTLHAYEKNESKNRYNDVLCMDSTRVRLKARRDYDDYIHASWITMPDKQKYICTQGPIAETVDDFWHMVFTEKSNVIVMLCSFVEGNHEKCYPYFHGVLDAPTTYGKMYTVTMVECFDSDPTRTILHKLLQLEVLGVRTKVHHLAYGGWPDHTAPTTPLPVVVLLKLARMLAAGNPITVHCSAGIGRSATFIGIDYAVQNILRNPDTSMLDMLKDLRNQRFHAIQSAIQYTFLHLCIIEVFIEDGVVKCEGNVKKFFDAYSRMLKKYKKACEQSAEEATKNIKR
ncbi:Protein-tyrosine phosphatase [Trichostrongylus colubriformis]|uniref:Protein-tyrosine phosphatase n=1 Tax=Trichostrongylus colubriformis TaxID=6319 RepID=A0AAN8FKT4_TRICO